MGMLGQGIRIDRTMDGDIEMFTVFYEKPEGQQMKGYMWNSDGPMTAEEFVKVVVDGGGTEEEAKAALDACRRHFGA